MAMAFVSLTAMSGKDSKREDSQDAMHSEMTEESNQNDSGVNHDTMTDTSNDMMA